MIKTDNRLSSIRTVRTFLNGRACSDTLFHVLSRAFDHPLNLEELAIMPFAGGIKQHGFQCGMIWGATLAAGAQAYRLLGPGLQAETKTINAAQRLVESFRAQNNHINCLEITDIDKSSSTTQMIMYFLIKGGSIGCFRMAAKYAPVAFSEINTALADKHIEAPSAPVSCSALLAQKMGVSDMHTVMAAGLAGGIGLCGGACGALGAAIWIIGMNINKERGVNNLWKDATFNSRLDKMINSFLKRTDFTFECSKIVGQRFENISDHAA
ncbi:MAG: C-GCAxxG-C-C family (seleno)protein [Desulfocucumaceae bacterium]